MTKSIKSIINYPREILVDIECHLSNNLPSIHIIGFASKATDEAKDRLRAAFASSDLQLPKKHITVNLSPADIPKEGTVFDLSIACAILSKSGQLKSGSLEQSIIIGELNLEGDVRPVRGVIGYIMAGKKLGFNSYYIPAGNLAQASLVPDVQIYPVKSLRQLYLHLAAVQSIKPIQTSDSYNPSAESGKDLYEHIDFQDISGQSLAKRALEIAAAGGHNILLSGQPGVGKSMLAKALIGILPTLTHQQSLEVTQLQSLVSTENEKIYTEPPLRSPHHSASVSSLVGGGTRPIPGEITLAHHGVLFLDELPEFSRSAIEAIRQPLEDGSILVSRVRESVKFPARFMLVATQNPCPCGYYGSHSRQCICSASAILAYQKKISGPIIDRIDLQVNTETVNHSVLLKPNPGTEPSSVIRQRVVSAMAKQTQRFGAARYNSSMTNREVRRLSKLTPPAKELLDQAASKLQLSARSYIRSVKVSRTIADLDNKQDIESAHIAEALQFRLQTTSQLLTPVI